MKTTIDISDSLLQEAKALSAQEQSTLRALIEEGLREVLSKHKTDHPFKLRRASFSGNGLQPEFKDGNWETIRASIYDGHGA